MSSQRPNDTSPNDFQSDQPELSANDRRLLDALIENEFDAQRIEPLSDAERQRVNVLHGTLGLLNDYPVDDADETLIHATLARINRYEQQQAATYRLESQQIRGGLYGLRVPNLVGVAAAILLVAGLLWPMLNMVRHHSINAACQDNLRRMAYAFGTYAADNNDGLPIATAGIGQRTWDTFANRINLAPLIEGQYCEQGHLNCPGHSGPAIATYSYQWQKPGTRLTWQTGRVTIILGDRNPLMDGARRGVMLPPDTLSPDHGGRGQNVLATDGSTIWLDKPVVSRNDNIWLPHGITKLKSGVAPSDRYDVFLAH